MPSLWARSWAGSGRERLPRLMAAAVCGLLVGSLLVAVPAVAQPPSWQVPAPPAAGKSTPVTGVPTKAVSGTYDTDTAAPSPAASSLWPAGGNASVAVDAGGVGAARSAVTTSGAGTGHAGGLGVRVRQPGVAGSATAGSAAQNAAASVPASVTVSVADRAVAKKAGVDGVLFTLVRGDGGTSGGEVALDVDYSGFANAYGGNYGSRLTLTQLPGCVLATPDRPACQVRTPVAGATNVPGSQTVSADALEVAAGSGSTFTASGGPTDTVPASDSTDTSAGKVPAGKAPVARSATTNGSTPVVADTSGQSVYAVTAAASSPAGTYAATSMLPAYSWAAGSQGGEFSYKVPLTMPPGLGGPTPDVTFDYSSGSVDGRTVSTNGQASWLGEGWNYTPGYIEQSYKSCKDDGSTDADLCWYSGAVMTMAFGNHSGRLVLDNSTGKWHAESDDGSRLELLTDTGNGNGDAQGRYWRMTTVDGTQYFFGKNKRYAGDTLVTNSTQNVLVYGNNVGEPCHNTTHDFWSGCDMTQRWNLDYVVDPRGNSMTYFYTKYQGKYGNWNGTDVHTYDISVDLDHIEYGTRTGSEATGHAPVKVQFGYTGRCIASLCLNHPENWPDTPWDQYCAPTVTSCSGQQTPTFWDPYKLDTVTTQRYDTPTAGYVGIDSWTMSYAFPSAGETGVSASLWLNFLSRTGLDGGSLATPAMAFGGNLHANLVTTTAPHYYHERLELVGTGTGGSTTVAYSPEDCTPSTMVGVAWDQNPKRCYPQWNGSAWVYYHKYVVNQVTDKDLVGGSPDETTSYAYSTVGSSTNVLWHYDSNDARPSGSRSWTDFAGYSTVIATHGATTGQQNITQTLYYRGMSGDVTATRNYDRAATITDSTGATVTDSDGLRGAVREEQVLDGSTVRGKTIHIPVQVTTGTRTGSWPDSNAVAYSVNEAETDSARRLGASTFNWRKVTYQYDPTYHLETASTDYGDTGSANTNVSTSDDVCTSTTYATPNTTAWLIAYPTQSFTTDCAASPTGTDYLSGTQTFYDGATSTTTAPTQGLATKTNSLSTVVGTTLTWVQQGRVGYDTYGRPTDTYDALDRHTTTAYTPATGGPLTATTVTNPLGHATTTTLGPGRGQPFTVTDPNGKVTTEQYDPLGELTKVFKPHTANAVTYTSATANQTFTDIVDTGTPVALTGDESHTQISLPFAFSFYGTSYSSAWLSTNGLMSFTGQSPDSASVPLPDTNLPNAAIYPFWDDLQTVSQSKVVTKTTGTAPNRAFTIEFYQFYLYGRSTTVSFTVTLNENGTIVFNYNQIDPNGADQGNAATVGIENATGTAATQYAYHQTLVANNQAITFTPSSSPAITQPDIQYDYAFGSNTNPAVITTKTLTAQNTQNASYTIDDGLMRTRQTQTQSPAAGGGRIIDDTHYNDRGLADKTTRFFNTSAPSSTLAGFTDANVDQQTRTSYDQLNRPTTVGLWSQNSLQWQTTAAYGDSATTVTPPDGGATVTTIDVFGRTTALSRYPTSVVTGTPETTTYGYDRLGQLKTVIDAAGNQASYSYDLLGRHTSTTDPDAGTSTSAFDAAGQVTSTVDARGQQISLDYDSLGRETTRWAGASGTGTKLATFVYDTLAKGQPTSSTRWVGSDQYTESVDGYNDQYQPTGQTVAIPMTQGLLAGTYHTTFGYDAIGEPTTVSYPAGGGLSTEMVATGYNQLGLPTTVTGDSDSFVSATSYDNYGQLQQRVYGTSSTAQLTRQYTYNANTQRLATTTSLLPDPAHSGQFLTEQQDTYNYAPSGDVTRITDGTDGQSQCYRYDGQHRLTDAYTATDNCTAAPTTAAITGSGKYPYWDTYSFDNAGRRTQDIHRTSTTATRTFHYPATGATQVHAASSVDYTGATSRTDSMTYDADGNTSHRTINGVVSDFTYNSEDQYAAATVHATGGNQQSTSLYDADGGLLIRKDPSGTTLYAAGQEYKLTGSTVTTTRYYQEAGTTVAVRTSAGKYWLAADHQGSTNLTINATTAVVQRRWYTPYGDDRATQGTWPTDRGFLDQQTNTSTGLIDDGAREYDPVLGTFTSPDPLVDPGNPATFNAYAYAGHNPLTQSDPSGLSFWGTIIGGVVQGATNFVKKTVTGLSGAAHYIGDNYSMAWHAVVDAYHGNWGGAAKLAGKVVLNTITTPYKSTYGAVKDIATTWWKGVTAALHGDFKGAIAAGTENGLTLGSYYAGAKVKIPGLRGDPVEPVDPVGPGDAAGPRDPVAPTDPVDPVSAGGDAAPNPDTPGDGGACSFNASTPVLLADGSTKQIKDVRVSDTVTAADPATATTDPEHVTAIHQHPDTELTDLTITDHSGHQSVLHTTPNHLFWDASTASWSPASALKPGETLRSAAGDTARVDGVISFAGDQQMYNLTVANLHTYYVIAGNTPVLVHNCDPGSAEKLRNALNNAGDLEPSTPHSPHHIVAGNSPKAASARAQLDRFGIGVNDAENGVWLPRSSSSPNPTGASVHSRVHTNEYYDHVNDLMGGARNRSEALDVINHVRGQLLGGFWP